MQAVLLSLLLATQIVGSEFQYTVRRGESLTSIGARFGVAVRALAEANGLPADARLKIGQVLAIDNRHIVPHQAEGVTILVNVPQRMLFWISAEETAAYPAATGRPDWKTPTGDFTVAAKETDPTWDVPPSIQEEMRRQGKPVQACVPPGPENPLGKFWLGLSIPNVGIHGTNAPSSIFGLATHGCIRLHPDDISRLFSRVTLGATGRIIYEPVLFARVGDAVFLEVHPDVYKRGADSLAIVRSRAAAETAMDLLDLKRVEEVIKKRDGLARDVTRR